MVTPIQDCKCEDFPCCEHADNYPAEPQYCDMCGYNYMTVTCSCVDVEENYDDDEGTWDDED